MLNQDFWFENVSKWLKFDPVTITKTTVIWKVKLFHSFKICLPFPTFLFWNTRPTEWWTRKKINNWKFLTFFTSCFVTFVPCNFKTSQKISKWWEMTWLFFNCNNYTNKCKWKSGRKSKYGGINTNWIKLHF